MSNDFLAWAVGGSANVESQASYAVDANLTNGYPANAIVPSGTFNKTLRQASFVAASLAQFMADNLAASISDNGSVATFEGNLRSALGYASGMQVWFFSTTAFTITKNLSVTGSAIFGSTISAGGTITASNGIIAAPPFSQNPAVSGTWYTAIPYSTFNSSQSPGLWIVEVICENVGPGIYIASTSTSVSPVVTLTQLQAGATPSFPSAQIDGSGNLQVKQTSGSNQSLSAQWLRIGP